MGNRATSKSYGEGYINDIRVEENEAGGNTLILGSAFPSNEVDWQNLENIKIAASRALDMADELYELIHSNCNLDDPVFENKNLAIYIAISAFACELYLKGMIYLENGHHGKQLKTHRLIELLECLSQCTPLDDCINSLKDEMIELDDAFQEMRYVFEYNAFNKEYLLIFDLLEETRKKSLEYVRHRTPTLLYSDGKIMVSK